VEATHPTRPNPYPSELDGFTHYVHAGSTTVYLYFERQALVAHCTNHNDTGSGTTEQLVKVKLCPDAPRG